MPELTDNMRRWFAEMLDDEIAQSKGAAANEHLWALGSDHPEAAAMHENNAEEDRQYVAFLQRLKEKYV